MKQVVFISKTHETRQYWAGQYSALGRRHEVAAANILIVPDRDGKEFIFHQDTIALYGYLQRHLHGKSVIELCSDDYEYRERTSISTVLKLSKVIVKSRLDAAVLVVALGNYIYNELNAIPNCLVEAALVIETDSSTGTLFEFKGEARLFYLLSDKLDEFSEDCQPS